jgi:hypothetical protein
MHTQTASEIEIFPHYVLKQCPPLTLGVFGQKKRPTLALESKRPTIECLKLIRTQEILGAKSSIGSHGLAPSRNLELELET